MKLQSTLCKTPRQTLLQLPRLSLAATMAEDIVGKTFKRHTRMALGHPPVERIMKKQVTQQGSYSHTTSCCPCPNRRHRTRPSPQRGSSRGRNLPSSTESPPTPHRASCGDATKGGPRIPSTEPSLRGLTPFAVGSTTLPKSCHRAGRSLTRREPRSSKPERPCSLAGKALPQRWTPGEKSNSRRRALLRNATCPRCSRTGNGLRPTRDTEQSFEGRNTAT